MYNVSVSPHIRDKSSTQKITINALAPKCHTPKAKVGIRAMR